MAAPPYGLNGDLGLRYQDVGGRIPHQSGQREKVEETDVHRDVTLTRRAMEALCVDKMVVFPTPCCSSACTPKRHGSAADPRLQ